MPKSQDRAEEMNRLLVEQATLVRAMKNGHQWTEAEKAESDQRALRLTDLAELLNLGDGNPGEYINQRIAAWMAANPLPLTTHRLAERLGEEESGGVRVQIGDVDRGYGYQVMADDIRWDGYYDNLVLTIPESVAELFRQQGRRQTQRAIQREIGV